MEDKDIKKEFNNFYKRVVDVLELGAKRFEYNDKDGKDYELEDWIFTNVLQHLDSIMFDERLKGFKVEEED